jgi:hypothetical protein
VDLPDEWGKLWESWTLVREVDVDGRILCKRPATAMPTVIPGTGPAIAATANPLPKAHMMIKAQRRGSEPSWPRWASRASPS